jgi:hypothetical protein
MHKHTKTEKNLKRTVLWKQGTVPHSVRTHYCKYIRYMYFICTTISVPTGDGEALTHKIQPT